MELGCAGMCSAHDANCRTTEKYLKSCDVSDIPSAAFGQSLITALVRERVTLHP